MVKNSVIGQSPRPESPDLENWVECGGLRGTVSGYTLTQVNFCMPVRHSPTVREPSVVRYLKKMLIRFGLAQKLKRRSGEVFFRLLWKRIALLAVVLIFVGYSLLVGGAYYFIKYERDFTEIRYFDLFFPHRWDNYRESRGDYYIERAQRILDGDEEEGHPFLLLRSGVSLSPDNRDGRLALARFYQDIGQRATGIRVLEGRIEDYTDDVEYLQTLFTMLFNDFQDDRVIELGESLLEASEDPVSRRDHMVGTAVATAHFHRGDSARAEDYVREYDLTTAKDGFLLQTRIEWERGDEAGVIWKLQRMIDQGTEDHDVFLMLVDFLLERGEEDRAARIALMRHVNDPLSHEPVIGLLRIHHELGDREAFREDTELFFTQFRRDEAAMHHLASVAGHWGDYELSARIYRHCQEHGMNLEGPAYHWVEALVAAGRYSRAIEVVENWDETPSRWERGYALPLQGQLAVAHFGTGNRAEGQLIISELFGAGFVRPDHLATVARRLSAMGEHGQARRVLGHVRNNYPHFQEALSQLIELDIETGRHAEILSNVRRYITMRQPSSGVLRRAYAYLESDLFLFNDEREEVLHSLEAVLGET